jgi:hypothetical protein
VPIDKGADDTRRSETACHLEAEAGELARHDLARAPFFEAELGMSMKVVADCAEIAGIGGQPINNRFFFQ